MRRQCCSHRCSWPNHTLQRPGRQRCFAARWSSQEVGGEVLPPPLNVGVGRRDRQEGEEMQKAKGLEYELHGEGQPVLLLPGSHVADAFLPLARETILTDRYQLIQYHRRGFGGSNPHTGPFSIEAQAQDALALLEALGVARVHERPQSVRPRVVTPTLCPR